MRFAITIATAAVTAALTLPATAQQGPCFYAQPNYQGPAMCIAPNQRVPALGAANDRLMSVQIPRGVRVTMCSDANFQGQCATFDQSIPNFGTVGAAGKVSSVAAEPAGAPRPGGGQAAAPPPPPVAPPPPRQQYGAQQLPPPQPQYAPPPPRGPQYAAPPGQYGLPGGLRDYNNWRETRRVMGELRAACEDGDTRACVQLGIIIGENRERRAQWRQEAPDLFWWER